MSKTMSFFRLFDKEEEQHGMYANLHYKYIKPGKNISNLNIESVIKTKIENKGLKGPGWRFIKHMSTRIIPFSGKVTKEA